MLFRSPIFGSGSQYDYSLAPYVKSTPMDMLRRSIPAGLNFTATGMPYWDTDIAGFFSPSIPANYHSEHTPLIDPSDAASNVGLYKDYPELFVRWFEWGAFQPVMRAHALLRRSCILPVCFQVHGVAVAMALSALNRATQSMKPTSTGDQTILPVASFTHSSHGNGGGDLGAARSSSRGRRPIHHA